MMNVILKFIIFTASFQTIIAKKVICDSAKDIVINENEIVFFESPGYPNEMIFDAKNECKLQITGNSTKENMIIIFVMTKGIIQRGEFIEGNELDNKYAYYHKSSFYHYTEANSLTFYLGDPNPIIFDAFQGFITYEEFNGCLLSNKTQIFEFTDETQMLYLRSSHFTGLQYYINENIQQCQWTFSAPEGYMFKLSDIKMIQDSTVVVFLNQTREVIKSHLPHYFDNKKISISYTNLKLPQKAGNEAFTAYLSIVNKVREISNTSCKFNERSEISVWEKRQETNNFGKIYCSIVTSIKPNHLLIVNITKFEAVGDSDVLGYYIDKEGLQFHTVDKMEEFALESNMDGSVRNIKWEYFTDDSFNGMNFRIEFQEVECICTTAPFVVPCSGESSYSLLNNNKNYFYCSNTVCNYTIQPNEICLNAYTALNIFMKFSSICDNYNITVNDEILKTTYDESMELWVTPTHNILLKPNITAIFQFLPNSYLDSYLCNQKDSYTQFSMNVGYVKITLESFYKNDTFDEILLTNENATAIIELNEMKENTALIVKLSDNLIDDDKMELSCSGSKIQSLLQCITLFTDNNLTNIFKLDVNNFTVTLPPSIIIYKYPHCDKEISKLTFRAKSKQSFGCIFHKSNFLHLSKLKGTKFSMISDPMASAPCEMIIFNLPGQYGFSKIWTNSKIENVVLKNGLDNTTLLSFNSATASQWQKIKLNAVSYIITMPANVSILIEIFYPSKKIEL